MLAPYLAIIYTHKAKTGLYVIHNTDKITIRLSLPGRSIVKDLKHLYYFEKLYRKAEEYDREATYYNNKAQEYLKEADYYSRHQNQDKARTYIRWANEASDKAKLRTTWANDAREKAQLRMKWAREAMEKARK